MFKRAVLFIFIAVGGLWIYWNYSFEFTGRIPPNRCLQTIESEQKLLSIPQAQELLAQYQSEEEFLPKESLVCSYFPTAEAGDLKLNKVGLTKNAQKMLNAAEEFFGYIPKGGYDAGGVSTGHIKGSAHYEGRAVDFFFRPHDEKPNRLKGWQLAIWATVNAEEYKIKTVIFDDKIWTRMNSSAGWRNYVHPSGDRKNPILRHLDHVHIDVS
jgi:hypothetical protein